jgi:ribosomal protein S18 acetylase RimI-like enzyme
MNFLLDNTGGARRLYERMGFRDYRESVVPVVTLY